MTENDIEEALIQKLTELKYIFRNDIRDRAALEHNFRAHFEALNRVHLTDDEFSRLLEQIVTPDVFKAAHILRERNTIERDDGTPLDFTLVNTKDWCKNTYEVIHQLRVNTDNSFQRYDVILLINGVPVAQIELKNLQISPRRAMEQIVAYKSDTGNGYGKTLLCFIQLFIVSNRHDTWYFANNNKRHFAFNANESFLPLYQFADEANKKITNLDAFAEKFLAKCTLGEMISRYMVLVASEQKMLMMRPYQIYAVKAIVQCIHDNNGNGYIWHTTGSGKTLTSFKASTLLKDNPDIEKCFFVVDRKDLDRQTREEFNRFQEGCVEENTNTEALVQRMLSDDYSDKVIVTTIQKLGLALDENSKRQYKKRLEPLRDKRVVFIFDECHRSQFGENHQAIKEFFPKAQLFGFTGTPIFEQNASYQKIDGEQASYVTTDDVFQKCLHQYTITNAIDDKNVLRFHVDYFKPDTAKKPKQGEAPVKKGVIKEILNKHSSITADRKFNALLATSSINDAIDYYKQFKSEQTKKQKEDPDYVPLNIACVFSPPAEGKPDIKQIQEDLPTEKADNKVEPEKKKAALTEIIKDYNTQYGTNYTVNEFDGYYQDVQQRIKSQKFPTTDVPHAKKIDLTIVVDMLLTGFDSTYLNTLYVDKSLKYHGLIQAFSRTNRVLNGTKPFGNILDFRQQQSSVDEAIALFSGEKNEKQAQEIWLVDPAPKVIDKLASAVDSLNQFMESQGVEAKPEEVNNLKGDAARIQFIELFKQVQRLKTQLEQYTDLTPESKEKIDVIISPEDMQGFKAEYISTAHRLAEQIGTPEGEKEPEAKELDFDFVLFSSSVIDYDYIMKLIADFTNEKPGKVKMTRDQIIGLIASDSKFIDSREDIESYIKSLKAGVGMSEDEIKKGFEKFKEERNDAILSKIAEKNGVEFNALKNFVNETLQRLVFDSDKFDELFESQDLGWKERTQKQLSMMEELEPVFKKMSDGHVIAGLSAYEQ